MNTNNKRTMLIIAIAATFTLSHASISTAEGINNTAAQEYSWLDRMGLEKQQQEKSALQTTLMGSNTVTQLRNRLQETGYKITAINQQSDNDIEYEVVQGHHTFEVKAKITDAKLKDIQVTNNIWQADGTKRALADVNYALGEVQYDEKHADRYSDAKYIDEWNKEKDALTAAMPLGKTFKDYQSILENKGYQITSINDTEPSRIEFEIVKRAHSFEVTLNRNADTQQVNKVAVTNNIWHSEETKKALSNQ